MQTIYRVATFRTGLRRFMFSLFVLTFLVLCLNLSKVMADAPIWQLQRLQVTAITITAAAMSQGLEASYSQSGNYNSAFNENTNFLNMMSSYQQYMGKKYSAAKQSGNTYYVLTTIKGKEDKGSGLVGVNLMTGKAVNQIIFKDKTPDYEVDEASGRMFNMNKGELFAFNITEQVEQTANEEKQAKGKR